MGSERRRADRVFVKIPITLQGGEGITRDANSTGVYFESDVDFVPGSEIDFTMTIQHPGCPKMIWNCKGRVVRVEEQGGRHGIAAQIVQSNLQAASHAMRGGLHAPF
jgi:hypothetical protein